MLALVVDLLVFRVGPFSIVSASSPGLVLLVCFVVPVGVVLVLVTPLLLPRASHHHGWAFMVVLTVASNVATASSS